MQDSTKHTNAYVGIDCHKRSNMVAVGSVQDFHKAGNSWRKLKVIPISNNRKGFSTLKTSIEKVEKNASKVAIAVDAIGCYSEPLIHFLTSKRYQVYHLETKAVKAARDRLLDKEDKTDRSDACCSAYLLYLRDFHEMTFRITEVRYHKPCLANEIFALYLQRYNLVKLDIRNINKMHQLFAAVFPEGEIKYFNSLVKLAPYYPTPEKIRQSRTLIKAKNISQKNREAIIQLAKETVGVPGIKYEWLIRELGIMHAANTIRLGDIEEQMHEKLQQHPYYEILLSFPGVGDMTAAILIGVIKDIGLWPNKRKLRKGLGVYGRTAQSAGSRVNSMGREGNPHTRQALFQTAMVCIGSRIRDNDFRDYFQRHVGRGKKRKKALMATMGKIAEVMYHCLKESQLYERKGTYKRSDHQADLDPTA